MVSCCSSGSTIGAFFVWFGLYWFVTPVPIGSVPGIVSLADSVMKWYFRLITDLPNKSPQGPNFA